MAKILWKPEIGTKVWFVTEHHWRRPDATKWQPEYEFMVFEGEVVRYHTGNWTDVTIRYREENPGPIELIDIMISTERPGIYDNPRDAAIRAKALTDDYVRRWGWVWNMHPDMPPMPRRWEKYLKEE